MVGAEWEGRHRFVHRLYMTVSTGEFDSWPECPALSHTRTGAVEQNSAERSALLDCATLMYCAVWFAVEQGQWSTR